jgi:chromosome segregation ATPase
MALDLLTSEAGTAILSAIFGGAGVKIIDKILSHRSEYLDENHRMRGELREQIEALTEELESTKIHSDEWRGKYWTLFEDNAQLKAQIAALHVETDSLRSEIKDLLIEVTRIKHELNNTPPQ